MEKESLFALVQQDSRLGSVSNLTVKIQNDLGVRQLHDEAGMMKIIFKDAINNSYTNSCILIGMPLACILIQ